MINHEFKFSNTQTTREAEKRRQTTNWTNSFGSKHYQPHISLLRPWNDLEDSLNNVGENFRSQISHLNFSRMEIKVKENLNANPSAL